MAQEVLELWLEELRESNETIPTYSHHPIVDEVPVNSTNISPSVPSSRPRQLANRTGS